MFISSLAYPIMVLHRTHKRPRTSPVEWLWSIEKFFEFFLCGLSAPQMAQHPFCFSSVSSYHSRETPYIDFNALLRCISEDFSGFLPRYALNVFAAFFLTCGLCLYSFKYFFLCGDCACCLTLSGFRFFQSLVILRYLSEYFFLYSADFTLVHSLQEYRKPSGVFFCLWNSVIGKGRLHLLHVFMASPFIVKHIYRKVQ